MRKEKLKAFYCLNKALQRSKIVYLLEYGLALNKFLRIRSPGCKKNVEKLFKTPSIFELKIIAIRA